MLSNTEMQELEAEIRKIFKERKKELNFTDAQIGELAFKNVTKNSWGKVRDLIHMEGCPSRKPQNMRLPDFLNVCEALRLSWYDVVENARKRVKEKP